MHTSIMWHFVVACKGCNLLNHVRGYCKHLGSQFMHGKQEAINPFIFSICAVEYVIVGLDWAGGVL